MRDLVVGKVYLKVLLRVLIDDIEKFRYLGRFCSSKLRVIRCCGSALWWLACVATVFETSMERRGEGRGGWSVHCS